MLVAMWAQFEAGGSTNLALGKGVIFGMFWFEFGYAGFMNTFFALVSLSAPQYIRNNDRLPLLYVTVLRTVTDESSHSIPERSRPPTSEHSVWAPAMPFSMPSSLRPSKSLPLPLTPSLGSTSSFSSSAMLSSSPYSTCSFLRRRIRPWRRSRLSLATK